MSVFSDAIKPFEPAIAQEAYNLLEQYKAEGLALAQAANVDIINQVEVAILADLPSGGVYLVLKPALIQAVKKVAPNVIAQLGGAEAALVALAEHKLIALGAKA